MSSLPRSTPEAQGIPSAAIHAFLDAAVAPRQELHSFMLVRHGSVVAEGWWEPFGPHRPHVLWSLSKSFCSTAVGFAVAEGLVTLDDLVVDIFPRQSPKDVSPLLARMRLRDMLCMATGHDVAPDRILIGAKIEDWPSEFLAHPVLHEPGTHFVYNSLATYMAGRIVQERSGMALTEYLTPRLFEPLGIPVPHWDKCPQGFDVGGWGMSARTEDIAKFGLLYLQDGVWDGKRVLPEGWAAEATRKHVQNGWDMTDWAQGYGFQFWRCQHGGYRGDGAFGQYCVVMPEKDAVLAITSCCDDLQAVLNSVWEHLLPAFSDSPLPENGPFEFGVREVLRPVATASPIEGHSGRFNLDPQPNGFTELDVRFGGDADTLVFSGPDSVLRVVAGKGEWRNSQSNGEAWAASGAWTGQDRYELKMLHLPSPFQENLTFTFGSDGFTAQRMGRGTFNPLEPAEFAGKRMPS